MSLSHPGSHCYRCGRPVRWYDNIPLLSYWILRGRCRQCGAAFSIRYFVVELLTALLFVLAYWRIGPTLALIPGLLFISLLIIATFTDIDHWIIPDRISIGGLFAGIALAAIWPLGAAAGNPLAEGGLVDLIWQAPRPLAPLLNSLAGAAAGFTVMWGIGAIGSLVFRKEAMGWGDIKLFAMFGAFCGVEPLLYILILSCFAGTLAGVIGIWLGRRAARRPADPATAPWSPDAERTAELVEDHGIGGEEREAVERSLNSPGALGPVRHHLPFGPSLALAAVIVYLYGEAIRGWFLSHILGPSAVL